MWYVMVAIFFSGDDDVNGEEVTFSGQHNMSTLSYTYGWLISCDSVPGLDTIVWIASQLGDLLYLDRMECYAPS